MFRAKAAGIGVGSFTALGSDCKADPMGMGPTYVRTGVPPGKKSCERPASLALSTLSSPGRVFTTAFT